MDRNRVVTHYDNLKVARNAPVEVIRAAYRVLAQQFHPDRFPDRALAERRMKIINQAYAVLADPDQRREHDAWIAGQEALQAAAEMLAAAESGRRTAARGRDGGGTAAHPGTQEAQFDDASRVRHDDAGSRSGDTSPRTFRAGAALRTGFSALVVMALQLALLGGVLWAVYILFIEEPATPAAPPASVGKFVPAPEKGVRPAATAPAHSGPSFAHASRCYWIYAPIAQTGRDFPHAELLRFGQERLKWYDAFFKRNKGNPELKRVLENSMERYEPSGLKFHNLLQEALSTSDPKMFAAAMEAAVTCDKILGIRTQFVPKM